MSTKVRFGNKIIQLPGTYSRIVAGQNNPPRDLDYGKLLIIDNNDFNATITGNGMLGGAGVKGELSSGKNTIYSTKDINEFRDFVGASWWWKAAEGLFNPDGFNNGVSEVLIIKPSTTVAASMTFTATGGGSAGGTFKVKPIDEGVPANGVANASILVNGYGFTITTGIVDNTKWIYKLWKGNYKGLAADGLPYDEILIANSRPSLVAQSPEFNNIATLIAWAQQDINFGKYFVLDPTSAVTGTGTVTSADITGITGYVLATGGTTAYDSLVEALEVIKDLNYNTILTTSSTANVSTDPDILKIIDHINNEAKYDVNLIVAGADTGIDTTIGYAKVLNSEKIGIVHSGIRKNSTLVAKGYRVWGAFYHAAYNVGRLLGMRPEVPLTFKAFDIDGLQDELKDKDKIKADAAGVLVTVYDDDFAKFINLHDVNTIQNSDFVLNNDGTSHLIQIVRIKSQLNKELIINAKLDLCSDPNGLNRNSLTEEDAIEWTKAYLQRKLGTLLVAWRNVTAITVGDNIFVDYEASPNSEIKGIFFTGRLYL